LRPENGYPVRLVVPGWEGNTSVKWLRRIKVGDKPWHLRSETARYTDPMPDGKWRQFSMVMGTKSVITSPSGGMKLGKPGFREVSGLAWSGSGKIKAVDVSFDGGRNWTRSTGLSSTGTGPVNVFNAVIAPAGGQVVWAMGLDLDEADAGAPSGGRHIYRSTDGGVTFMPVVDQSDEIRLQNGPTMAAPPDSTDVVYFTFGMSFGNYGTDVFRYDEATGQVTKTHNDFDRVPAIAFNPADPSVMYLGLAYEGGF